MKKSAFLLVLALGLFFSPSLTAEEGDVKIALGYQAERYIDIYGEYGLNSHIAVGLNLTVFFDIANILTPTVIYYVWDATIRPYIGGGVFIATPTENCISCDKTLIGPSVEAGLTFDTGNLILSIGYKADLVEADSWYDGTGPKLGLGARF